MINQRINRPQVPLRLVSILKSHKCARFQVLRSYLAPLPSISCPRSTELYRKPLWFLRCVPEARNWLWCPPIASPCWTWPSQWYQFQLWVSCCPHLCCFFPLLLFSICAREECYIQLPAAWALEGMIRHGFLFIASALGLALVLWEGCL